MGVFEFENFLEGDIGHGLYVTSSVRVNPPPRTFTKHFFPGLWSVATSGPDEKCCEMWGRKYDPPYFAGFSEAACAECHPATGREEGTPKTF